jgi:festuclavine dehydrogenase
MTSPSSVLLTGGTGKVASCIALLLQQAGHSTVIASRKGTAPPGFTGVRFDWLDDSTYDAPFQVASNITSISLVAPGTSDPLPPMKAFIDFAITKGVKRFVLLSASVFEAGGPAVGQVHQYLIDLKVEFAALRSSWFMGELAILTCKKRISRSTTI